MKAIALIGERRSGAVLRGLLVLGIFVTFLTGCKKEFTEPEDINPSATQLEASVLPMPDTVPVGSCVYLEVNSKNGKYLDITLNGVKQPSVAFIEGNARKLFTILGNSTFTINIVGENTIPLVLTEMRNVVAKEVVASHPKPTITLTATPLRTESGTSVVINLMTTDANAVASTLSGVSGTFGNFPTPPLMETTTYTFTAIGEGGVTVDSITIIVEPKICPFYGYIQLFPWKTIKLEYRYLEGNIWFDGDPSVALLSRKNVFLENLNYEVYQFGTLINYGNKYSIADSVLYWGGLECKIDTLNTKIMVLEYMSCTLSGTDCRIFRETYIKF